LFVGGWPSAPFDLASSPPAVRIQEFTTKDSDCHGSGYSYSHRGAVDFKDFDFDLIADPKSLSWPS